MNKDFKRKLMSFLQTGCGHASMNEAALCHKCGKRFKEGEALYNKMRRERPELFAVEKPEFKPSAKLQGMMNQFVDRMQNDKLYRRHLELSQYGTPEEQEREAKLSDQGFYERNWSPDYNAPILTEEEDEQPIKIITP